MTTFQLDQDFAGRQSQGRRKEQQDCYAFSVLEGKHHSAEWLLTVVADGLGGYRGGRQAATAAVQGFMEGFLQSWDRPEAYPTGARRHTPSQSLEKGLLQANQAIHTMAKEHPALLHEAGTTLLATVVGENQAYWISVGDSPLFLWREDELHRLNADHSMRAILDERVAAGELLPEEVERDPARNMLLSALLGDTIEMVDAPAAPFALREGDVLVSASDGLLTLPPLALKSLLMGSSHSSAADLAETLLHGVAAVRDPHQDNTTVVLVRI